MQHATYLRQLFPTLTLFGVMVFSGASCTGTSKPNVVQENNPKCPSRPLSKIDGKNGEQKSDTDQKGEGGSGRPQASTPKCPSRPLSKIDGKNGEQKSDTDQKGEGGSGRPQASTPNPPVASPPVVEPNNPAGVAVSERELCVNQLSDALHSEAFEKKAKELAKELKAKELKVEKIKKEVTPEDIQEDIQVIQESIQQIIVDDYTIVDAFLKSGESAIEYCDKLLKNFGELIEANFLKGEEKNNKNANNLKLD